MPTESGVEKPLVSLLFRSLPHFSTPKSQQKTQLHVALISEPPPTPLYHTLTATCSVALMCLAPSIFTSQDYISDHLWKANIN